MDMMQTCLRARQGRSTIMICKTEDPKMNEPTGKCKQAIGRSLRGKRNIQRRVRDTVTMLKLLTPGSISLK